MPDEIYGDLVMPDAVELAVVATLKKWMPEYLAWTERSQGRPPRSIPSIGSWVVTTDLNRWPEERLPSVLVMNTGLAGEPVRHGRSYTAKFAVGIAVIASAKDQVTTDALAKLYTGLIRQIMVGHPDLGGLADAVEWVDEGYDALGDRKRTLTAGQAVFRVEVPDVAGAYNGPAEPRDDPYAEPYPDDPVVLTTDVTVEGEPLE